MVCHGFKGGIGTASRVVEDGWMVGVLVQANHGRRPRLRVNGVPVGERIGLEVVPLPESGADEGAGSIIVVIATDAPLLPGQCERLARRAAFGIARTGGMGERSSGDFALCFATGNRNLEAAEAELPLRMLNDTRINPLYEATIDAVEESILNAMLAAETMTGYRGNTVHALPQRVAARSAQPLRISSVSRDTSDGIAPARADQLLVRADLGDAALVEDDDLIGVAHGREPVRDRDRRPPFGEPLERLLHRAARSACRAPRSPRRGRGSADCAGSSARSRSAAARRPRSGSPARRRPSRSPRGGVAIRPWI